jgi:hypothetical protein
MALTLRDATKQSRFNSQATERNRRMLAITSIAMHPPFLPHGRKDDKQIIAEARGRAIFVLYGHHPDSDIIKSGQVCFAPRYGCAIGWGDGVLREYLVAEELPASSVTVSLRSSPSVGGNRTNRLGLGSSLLCLLIIWISLLPGVLRRVHDLWA